MVCVSWKLWLYLRNPSGEELTEIVWKQSNRLYYYLAQPTLIGFGGKCPLMRTFTSIFSHSFDARISSGPEVAATLTSVAAAMVASRSCSFVVQQFCFCPLISEQNSASHLAGQLQIHQLALLNPRESQDTLEMLRICKMDEWTEVARSTWGERSGSQWDESRLLCLCYFALLFQSSSFRFITRSTPRPFFFFTLHSDYSVKVKVLLFIYCRENMKLKL